MKTAKRLFLLSAVVVTVILCFVFSAGAFTETGKCGDKASYTFDSDTGKLVISGSGKVWDFRNDADFYDYHQKPWEEIVPLIKKVVFKKGITYTGADCFSFCPNLEKVVFSETVTEIASFSFRGCEKLKNPVFPENLQSLGQQAFDLCKSITKIEIPDGLTFLDACVFSFCSSLEYVYIGGKSDIGYFVFGNSPFRCCYALEKIYVSPDNIALTDIDGILYNKDKDCLVQYPSGRREKSYTLPDGVKSIYSFAMEDNSYIEEIVIPDSLEAIGIYGISDCRNLKGIYYEGSQKQWGNVSVEIAMASDQILNTPIHFLGDCVQGDVVRHNYKTVITKATLTKNGKIVKECKVCSEADTTVIYYPKTIKLSKTSYTYNGKEQKPTVTVKDSKGKVLKNGTDYKVTYEKGRTNPGKYSVRIDFTGNYSGTKRLYFTITPKTVGNVTASQSSDAIRLKWNKVTGADGYRIFKYNAKTKKYEKLKDVKDTTLRVEKLKSGTTYKFKVRAYTKDDGTIWGAYSDVLVTATKPATPKITKLTTKNEKVSIVWSDVSGESGYQVYYSTKKDGDFKKVATYKANIVKGSKSKLISGKTYYFKVRAYRKTESGNLYSSWSPVKSIKVK